MRLGEVSEIIETLRDFAEEYIFPLRKQNDNELLRLICSVIYLLYELSYSDVALKISISSNKNTTVLSLYDIDGYALNFEYTEYIQSDDSYIIITPTVKILRVSVNKVHENMTEHLSAIPIVAVVFPDNYVYIGWDPGWSYRTDIIGLASFDVLVKLNNTVLEPLISILQKYKEFLVNLMCKEFDYSRDEVLNRLEQYLSDFDMIEY